MAAARPRGALALRRHAEAARTAAEAMARDGQRDLMTIRRPRWVSLSAGRSECERSEAARPPAGFCRHWELAHRCGHAPPPTVRAHRSQSYLSLAERAARATPGASCWQDQAEMQAVLPLPRAAGTGSHATARTLLHHALMGRHVSTRRRGNDRSVPVSRDGSPLAPRDPRSLRRCPAGASRVLAWRSSWTRRVTLCHRQPRATWARRRAIGRPGRWLPLAAPHASALGPVRSVMCGRTFGLPCAGRSQCS